MTGPEEMRFSKCAVTPSGTEIDLVVRVLDTQDEYTPDDSTLNTGEGDHGFQIHFGVKADPAHLIYDVEFEFSFEDQKGNPVELDLASFKLFDIDHDRKKKIRERVCYNVDDLDRYQTMIPGFDLQTLTTYEAESKLGFFGPKLLTSYDPTKNCDGSNVTTLGSVRIQSNQVGFGCDFKKSLTFEEFEPVMCESEQCQNIDKPLKCSAVGHYFGWINQNNETCDHQTDADNGCTTQVGIHPKDRYIKPTFTGKSSFRVTMGLLCNKAAGKKCTRNFEFRGQYQASKGKCK